MDESLRTSLAQLGITTSNYRVLMLLPLVYVAWADGKMEDVEITRIDDVARQRLFIELPGLEILDGWLREPPPKDLFDRGLRDLFLLAQTDSGDPLVHPEELHELLSHAEAVARATASALDEPNAVTPEEEDALAEIARILHIDNGVSWGRLLDELDAGPASIRAGAMPRSRR